jgi:hypothetical protein
LTDLTNTTAEINTALDMPFVRGFSIRTPWSALETSKNTYSFQIWDAARALADAKGKALAVRPMTGWRCPAYIYTTDACRFFSTHDRGAIGNDIGSAGGSYVTIGTLNGAVNASVTAMVVDEIGSSQPVPAVPFKANFGTGTGNEYVNVTARSLISGNQYNYTITRGATVGTTTNAAASHSAGVNIQIGQRIPDPCKTDGTPNDVLASRYQLLMEQCATWCRAHRVTFMHAMWYGLYWDEIYNDTPLTPASGRAGYSTDAGGGQSQQCIDAHKDLLTRLKAVVGTDLATEVSSSGHGASGQILTQTQAHIRALFGDNSPQVYFEANNVGTAAQGYSATGTPTGISKGLQLVASDSNYTAAEWEEVMGTNWMSKKFFDYMEVYCSSNDFSDANSVYLKKQIRRAHNMMRPHKPVFTKGGEA